MPERRVVLTHNDAPKSLNASGAGSRAHWGAAHREKKAWEAVWGMLLLSARVRQGAVFCECSAVIRWKHRNRRDVSNYTASLVKPLADTLAPRPDSGLPRYLPDDTAEFFHFGDLTFEYPDVWEHTDPRVKAVTVVTLDLTYPEP